MTDNATLALEAKNRGNAAFQAKNYKEAVEHFTLAIKHDPENHVLYSNRSGAYASLNMYKEALDDALKTTQYKPDWAKGYSRLGIAYFYLEKYSEALDAYNKGLQIEPSNAQLLEGKASVEDAMSKNAFGNIFGGDIWAKIRTNPNLAPYERDPEFVRIVGEIQKNPQAIMQYANDPRISKLFQFLILGDQAFQEQPQAEPQPPKQEPPKAEPKKEEPKKEEIPKEKKEALELKEKGNQAYKKKQFDEARQFYEQASALDPDNFSIQLNISALLFETNKFDECIATCQKVIEEGRAKRASYDIIAKAYARIGNVHNKAQRYDEAINAYEKSLTEDYNNTVDQSLKKVRKLKSEKEAQDYLNPQISLEEKEKGNAFFKQQNFPEAIKAYTEAIRRNPQDHVLYSNRAASYTKLGEFQLGLQDAETCLKINPTFVKAYIRKGNLEYSMKQYYKAMETFDKALKLEPDNYEAQEGIQKVIQATRSGQAPDAEAVERAMADPEIQAILNNPRVMNVLNQLKEDPKAAQRTLMGDAELSGMIEKLINAGILRQK